MNRTIRHSIITFTTALLLLATLNVADAMTGQEMASSAAVHPALIPMPASVEWQDGALPANRASAAAIRRVHIDGCPAEGYELQITTSGAVVRSSSAAGEFYAEQTLKQLRAADGSLPCVAIRDAPRFPWRGLMLDCSRTFQSVEYLRKTIDRLAAYKMNVLHLHLTDDQGWRLEIKKYPELTRKGARFPDKYHEPEARQGFYTQDQMRELVAYAAQRHVTIVPEIEMPGHSLAALSVMPQLSCTGGPFEIFPFFKGPGMTSDIYCAGNEEVFTFMSNVLAEVAAIFPSTVVHIGGDEAPKARWKKCPRCQQRMKEHGLKNEEQLQAWFNQRVEQMLKASGRRLIGWDEIMAGGLTPGSMVMSWRGTQGGEAAALAGHDVVMSPTSHCYFDYSYKQISTETVYSYEPVPAALPADKTRYILGAQANFWSHIDRTPERTDFQIYPRVLALAERVWSPQNCRVWQKFHARLQSQQARLAAMGVNYNASEK